jgi:Spy/CpxP family protein refolding chaperone
MKLKWLIAAFILLLSTSAAVAQNPQRGPSPDMGFPMGGWQPPAALMGEWWNDPEIAADLRLTQPQKQQLEQVSTNLKLTLIDAGATGLKAYVRLQALLDADQFGRMRPRTRPDATHDGTHDRPRREPPSSLRNPPQ